jgi:hypothetical protein
MASPNARRPVTALTAANRPPNDSRAGIAAAHKESLRLRQELRQATQKRRDDFGLFAKSEPSASTAAGIVTAAQAEHARAKLAAKTEAAKPPPKAPPRLSLAPACKGRADQRRRGND